MEIADEFKRHGFVLKCIGREEDRENYKAFESRKVNKTEYQNAIRFLSQCLETYHGRKPIVLIDEYDVPLENAFSCGYYDKMINFKLSIAQC